mmetsp:Transcript_6656/g.18568  ORF Transcript_6656/g.18568 Transcript_6656/m.18568 type:complete len:200 (-) Transcript_6656:1161-1760(-)
MEEGLVSGDVLSVTPDRMRVERLLSSEAQLLEAASASGCLGGCCPEKRTDSALSTHDRKVPSTEMRRPPPPNFELLAAAAPPLGLGLVDLLIPRPNRRGRRLSASNDAEGSSLNKGSSPFVKEPPVVSAGPLSSKDCSACSVGCTAVSKMGPRGKAGTVAGLAVPPFAAAASLCDLALGPWPAASLLRPGLGDVSVLER